MRTLQVELETPKAHFFSKAHPIARELPQGDASPLGARLAFFDPAVAKLEAGRRLLRFRHAGCRDPAHADGVTVIFSADSAGGLIST